MEPQTTPQGGNQKPSGQEPGAQNTSGEDLEGLKRNRDDLLKEKKTLESKLKAFQDKESKAEADRMKAAGETDKLLSQREKELADTRRELRQNKLKLEMIQGGIKDPDYAEILERDVSEDFSNVAEVIKSTLEKKPWLGVDFQQPSAPLKPGVSNAPAKAFQGPGHIFTSTEIDAMSIEDFTKNQDEIMRQNREGLIK